MDRTECVAYTARGKERWTPKLGSLLLGMGVGVGLGMLFAPASGEETRNTIVEQTANLKDKVFKQAGNLKDKVRATVRRENRPVSTESSAERMPHPA
jgi:gas vesicle protein